MEESIKILEVFIETLYGGYFSKEAHSINELIKGYTILKNQNNNLLYELGQSPKKVIDDLHKFYNQGVEDEREKWKSKIKEKLEEQYELFNTPNRQKEYSQEVVDVLQELMEDK